MEISNQKENIPLMRMEQTLLLKSPAYPRLAMVGKNHILLTV